jgi:hypothetical protein
MAKGIKTGGRKVGTKNKLSGTTKEMITEIVTKELQKLPGLIEQLESKERIDLIIKLLPYISPKILPVEAPKIKAPIYLHRLMSNKNTNPTTSNNSTYK